MLRITAAKTLSRAAFARAPLAGAPRRCFVTSSPQNFIAKTLKYVKSVDDMQTKLSNTPPRVVADKLVAEIADKPEALALLSLFHHELHKIGISPASPRDASAWSTVRYRALYVTKLAKIHNIFWDLCQFLDVSERTHKLGFSPGNIGVLDPANFSEQDFSELQSGVFRGVDFRDVQMVGGRRF